MFIVATGALSACKETFADCSCYKHWEHLRSTNVRHYTEGGKRDVIHGRMSERWSDVVRRLQVQQLHRGNETSCETVSRHRSNRQQREHQAHPSVHWCSPASPCTSRPSSCWACRSTPGPLSLFLPRESRLHRSVRQCIPVYINKHNWRQFTERNHSWSSSHQCYHQSQQTQQWMQIHLAQVQHE